MTTPYSETFKFTQAWHKGLTILHYGSATDNDSEPKELVVNKLELIRYSVSYQFLCYWKKNLLAINTLAS